MGEGHRFSWSLRRNVFISSASSRFNLWPFLSTCRMDILSGDILWLVWRIWSAILDSMRPFFTALTYFFFFIVKRIISISREKFYLQCFAFHYHPRESNIHLNIDPRLWKDSNFRGLVLTS